MAGECAGCLQAGSAALALTAVLERELGDGCWWILGTTGDSPRSPSADGEAASRQAQLGHPRSFNLLNFSTPSAFLRLEDPRPGGTHPKLVKFCSKWICLSIHFAK